MTTQTDADSTARADARILDALNDLLQLDYDAIGAYEIAVERLEDRAHAIRVEEFMRDHDRHVRELNLLIQGMGGVPRNEPHPTGPFKQALQAFGALGGDRGTLIAFRTNELQVRARYRAAAARASGWPAEARTIVQRNALDEERHYRWVVDALGEMDGAVAAARQRVAARAAEVMGSLRPPDGAWGREGPGEQVRETPLAAALTSFVLGFAIGRILR